MNSIERIRTKVGLTKPQMMRILEANPTVVLKPAQAFSLFSMTDEEILEKVERRQAGVPSGLLQRAQEIEALYEAWVEQVKIRLESVAQISPNGILRTRDVARVLGISDFHLSQLRIRGQVSAQKEGKRRYVYTLDDVLELIDQNSNTVTPESRKTRGPLTNAFLSWAAENSTEERELIAVGA